MGVFTEVRKACIDAGLASDEDVAYRSTLSLTERLRTWHEVCGSWGMGQAFRELGLILEALAEERDEARAAIEAMRSK